MSAVIRLPALTPTMTEGALARWLVDAGDTIQAGQPIAEVETDKAMVEILAPRNGKLGELLVREGPDPIPVDEAIARYEETAAEARGPSSPAARRVAAAAGIDVSSIAGTGPGGRVIVRDVEAATVVGGAGAGSGRPFERLPLTMMRRTIARRMAAAKRDVPHFYLRADLDVSELAAWRGQLKAAAAVPWTLADAIVKAVALALAQVPALNVEFCGDHVRAYRCVDVAIAVAVGEGLVTPVIRDVDRRPLAELAAEAHELAERARSGRLQPHELQGGSLTVSNLGMLGVREFTAILNPPQAAILAVGAAEPRPVVRDGQLAIATIATSILSCDHRVVDGVVAADFLDRLGKIVSSPASLLQ